MYDRWSLASVHDSARLGVVSPAGIGRTIASWIAYMTMNGVLNASVSAGSSQREASVTCRAQRISPATGLPDCARAIAGWTRLTASSRSATRTSDTDATRGRPIDDGMPITVVSRARKVNRAGSSSAARGALRAAAGQLGEDVGELLGRDGLGQVGVEAGLPGAPAIVGLAVPGDRHQDRLGPAPRADRRATS